MSGSTREVRPDDVRLRNHIVERIDQAPLSELLPAVLRLAKSRDHAGLARWVRLELGGYFNTNPALTSGIEVPVYRTIAGQYYDDCGRRFVNNDPKLSFIFEDRLRFGVKELEELAATHQDVRVQRTSNIAAVREFLKVEVTTFTFSASAIAGVLATIRSELIDRFADLDDEITSSGVIVGDQRQPQQRSWLRDHLWPVLVTMGTGLVVAYLSFKFGWL